MKVYFCRNMHNINTWGINYILGVNNFYHSKKDIDAIIKIDEILKTKFSSIKVLSIPLSPLPPSYYEFSFDDLSDDAFFIVWSSDGIEL